ncbi:MAG: SpoIID/LytB domain-containing protein [Candidatus Jettenia sp.]|nr:MAG: SpoIID/LytB domain-containing protein [Candidatus Jettenia sp. AMX1]MBC6928233.1 SpoIID/LytB domain-containing protein [Candidatus Jettenia sp.]MCE7880486.1 SpoIID/LytB domain-containing protein [Candidatus Jettenia sp. AMX1]MCQ3926294.1 SpoIID/LytB domain-containing protein [Candidatus Jettenia sp.]MDL1938730.1 SpoIID/LytB domain-containing protein [Candidatus Jettenia sp. AMX1]
MTLDIKSMVRPLLLMIATLLSSIAGGMPLSCQRSAPEVQDGIYDYKNLLEKKPVIRVLLVKDAREARLAIDDCYQITDSLANSIDQGQGLQKSTISINEGSISVGSRHYNTSEIRITTLREGRIEFNNIRYRGEIRILQQPNNRFSVIEEVDLESFIAGVVGSEMPKAWNEEALRAQAIIARTYAMYKRRVKQDKVYHLDMLELAYRGMLNETVRINKIVQETKGIIMVYNWNIFPAYFHSTCGGHTENCNHVFGDDSIPPLRGVVCNYCNNSKYSLWSKDISKSDIEKKLREANIYVSNIHTINALDQGLGEHCSRIEIISADGTREMSANGFRLLIGPNYLYSTAFDSRSNGKSITFSGKGLGHGVGLCQYGAQNMAKNGFGYESILKHYYPKIELVRVY